MLIFIVVQSKHFLFELNIFAKVFLLRDFSLIEFHNTSQQCLKLCSGLITNKLLSKSVLIEHFSSYDLSCFTFFGLHVYGVMSWVCSLLLLIIGFMAYCNHDLSGAHRHLLYRSMQHGLVQWFYLKKQRPFPSSFPFLHSPLPSFPFFPTFIFYLFYFHFHLNPIIHPCILQVFHNSVLCIFYPFSCCSQNTLQVPLSSVWLIFCFNLILSSLHFLQYNSTCSAFSVILHSSDLLWPNRNNVLFNPVWSSLSLVKTVSSLLFLPFTPCALIHFCIL